MGPKKTSGGRVEGTLNFFEDGLPPPTLSQIRPLQDNNRPLIQPSPEPTHEVLTPVNASAPSQSPATTQAAPPSGMTADAPEPVPQERIFICLPG